MFRCGTQKHISTETDGTNGDTRELTNIIITKLFQKAVNLYAAATDESFFVKVPRNAGSSFCTETCDKRFHWNFKLAHICMQFKKEVFAGGRQIATARLGGPATLGWNLNLDTLWRPIYFDESMKTSSHSRERSRTSSRDEAIVRRFAAFCYMESPCGPLRSIESQVRDVRRFGPHVGHHDGFARRVRHVRRFCPHVGRHESLTS